MAGSSRAALALFVALVLFASGTLDAAGTRRIVQGPEEFRKATLEGLAVDADGALQPAPEVMHRWATDSPYVWSLAWDARGRLVAGTGDGGVIYRSQGDGVVPWAHTLALEILSLLPFGDGILAGTSPDGVVYFIDEDGNVKVALDLPQQSVWALAPSGPEGWVAATGPGARVVEVSPDAPAGRVLRQLPATNATTLLRDGPRLWVGTQGPGLVYRLEDGKAQVVFEAPEDEIRALVSDGGGGLLVLSLAESTTATPGGSASAPAAGSRSANGHGANGASRVASRVTWLPADGGMETRYAGKLSLLSLVGLPSGELLVGEAGKGRIHRIDREGRVALVADLQGGDPVVLLVKDDGRVVVGMGNLGEIVELGSAPAKEGVLTSEALETPRAERWGVLDVEAEGKGVRYEVRTGFRRTPDDTWSEWSSPAAAGTPMRAPLAPFLQYRLHLPGGHRPARVRSVRLAYAERNLPPTITSLKVEPAGQDLRTGGLNRPPSPVSQRFEDGLGVEFTLYPKRAHAPPEMVAWVRGLRILRWEAKDPNDDELRYALQVQRLGDDEWIPLAEDLEQPIYAWDTRSYEDGVYRFRVVAADAPSNPVGAVRSSSRVGVPVHVDNTPPRIRELQVRDGQSRQLAAHVRDTASPLRDVSVRVDDGRWRPVAPVDGVLDGREERFEVALPDGDGGRRLWLRAVDAAGNVALRETGLP